ncbi:hypothetical protein U9M48_029127 [Paspalum notatum var. saurae]|uniref:Uncharacterized protein n=1 Tax=Paspalum notatum var. saurae TaxID=547442 RepID=A0AAQ3U2D2_PASNO
MQPGDVRVPEARIPEPHQLAEAPEVVPLEARAASQIQHVEPVQVREAVQEIHQLVHGVLAALDCAGVAFATGNDEASEDKLAETALAGFLQCTATTPPVPGFIFAYYKPFGGPSPDHACPADLRLVEESRQVLQAALLLGGQHAVAEGLRVRVEKPDLVLLLLFAFRLEHQLQILLGIRDPDAVALPPQANLAHAELELVQLLAELAELAVLVGVAEEEAYHVDVEAPRVAAVLEVREDVAHVALHAVLQHVGDLPHLLHPGADLVVVLVLHLGQEAQQGVHGALGQGGHLASPAATSSKLVLINYSDDYQ